VFDDCIPGNAGKPGWFAPYFGREPLELDESQDYSNADATLKNSGVFVWMHGLGEVASALIEHGLGIRVLREHDAAAWRVFPVLEQGQDGLFQWPDKPWLPVRPPAAQCGSSADAHGPTCSVTRVPSPRSRLSPWTQVMSPTRLRGSSAGRSATCPVCFTQAETVRSAGSAPSVLRLRP
jgi:hypothetical protein